MPAVGRLWPSDDDDEEEEDDEDDDVEDCCQEGGVCGHYGQVEDIMWTVHTILFMFSLYSLYIFISAIYVLALEFLYSQCCLFRIGSVLPLIDIFT